MKLHNNNINNENNNELNSNKSKPKKKKFIDREKAKELTLKAAKALDDKKLENITILDLDGVTTLSDYFILATASSSPQMKAGSDAVYKELKEDGVLPYAENDNDPEAVWYLSDYGFLVVHIFTEEGREYYNLDKLWHEAKKIDLV
ncbi:ribosome silencing factor [Brachyspira innocens]|uniref:ribosome silencing factor n=1 Tax=Brachyspira innocens TaxID=13264 RepID=UPI00037D8AE5|nr:ribosome silencing factor [Brachyspira innocens]